MPERWIHTKYSRSLTGRPSRDTSPEIHLRSALHRAGFRFRLHQRIGGRLTADIVLPRHRIAIFVDGCFWHQHGCKVGGAKMPAGPNANAWAVKFANVKERERRSTALLHEAGYAVIRVWECEVRKSTAKIVRAVAHRASRLRLHARS